MYSICFTRFLVCSLSFDFCTSPSSASYVSLPSSLSLTYLHEGDGRAQTRTHHSSRAVDRDGKRPGRRSPRTEKHPSENSKNSKFKPVSRTGPWAVGRVGKIMARKPQFQALISAVFRTRSSWSKLPKLSKFQSRGSFKTEEVSKLRDLPYFPPDGLTLPILPMRATGKLFAASVLAHLIFRTSLSLL